MLFVPTISRVKSGADAGPFLLVASTFTLPVPGVILNLVASSVAASLLARCVPRSSRVAAYHHPLDSKYSKNPPGTVRMRYPG
jgi:hypothetical protein